MSKCRYQKEIKGEYRCRKNSQALGPCLGKCAKYEEVSEVHPSCCPKCNQPMSNNETIEIMVDKVDKLAAFIRNAITDHFNHHEAFLLLQDLGC